MRSETTTMTTLKPEDTVGVPVLCESCGTAIAKENEASARQTAEKHNESRHDGEEVAKAITSPYDVDTSELSPSRENAFVRDIISLLDR